MVTPASRPIYTSLLTDEYSRVVSLCMYGGSRAGDYARWRCAQVPCGTGNIVNLFKEDGR